MHNALFLANLREYRHDTSLEIRWLCYISVAESIFNHFYALRPEIYRIWWNNAK